MARRRMGDSDFADRIDESRRLLVAFVQEMEKPYKMVHSVLGNTISGEPKVVIEAVRTAELLPTNMVVNANQADPVERLRRLHVDSANKIVKAYAVVAAQRKLIGKDETIVDVHDRDKHLVEKTEKHQKEMLRLREEGKLKAHDALYRSAKLQKDEKVHKKGPSAFGRLKNLFRTKNDIVKDF